MSSLPLLTLMMVVPLVGAIIVATLPGDSAKLAKPIALGASLVTLVLALLAWARRRFDVDFAVTTGLTHVEQPQATVERLRHAVSVLGPF